MARRGIKVKKLEITYNNHTFHGYEYGDRSLPSVVCLHGMTGDSNSFLGIKEFLIKDFHLIILDSPGHGNTERLKKEEDYRFSSLAKRLKQVISKIVNKPLYLLGHSWGADLALHFTKAFPEMVNGVIMIDGGYVFPEQSEFTKEETVLAWEEYINKSEFHSWEEVTKTYQEYTTKKWDINLDAIIHSNFREDNGGYKLKADRFSLLSTIKAFYKEPCSTTFRSIKCPVLLFHATLPEVDVYRDRGIQEICSSIKNLKIIGIRDTKHNVHWDSPETVAKEIKLWRREKNLK
jgi:pimeloyl-ACP methyl ester carboxylesterase